MQALENDIKRVNTKLQQLLKQYLLLQKHNESMNIALSDLKKLSEKQLGDINRLQTQVSILKSASGEMNEVDKKSFDKQLGQYIKEIDKCIALISE
jgi:hypothetical protein